MTSAITWTCLASIRARGNSMLEGKIITLAALINAVLDPILIFGLLCWLAIVVTVCLTRRIK